MCYNFTQTHAQLDYKFLNRYEKMKKNQIFSAISLAISIVTLCLFCFRSEPFKIDAYNTAVTVFGVIITILLGWQIFSIINFRNEKEEMFKEVKEKEKILASSLARIESEQQVLVQNLFDFYIKVGDTYQIIISGMDLFRLTQQSLVMSVSILQVLIDYGKKNGFNYKTLTEMESSIDFLEDIIDESVNRRNKEIVSLKKELIEILKQSEIMKSQSGSKTN